MTVRRLTKPDIEGAVALQRDCFPPPFPQEFLRRPVHLEAHIAKFSEGQFVAELNGRIVGSASNCLVSESNWQAHRSWYETVGGPYIENHDPAGNTLYGLDISVHPAHRAQGIGRALYQARFDHVKSQRFTRYGTACRVPGYLTWSQIAKTPSVEKYIQEVLDGSLWDRTLSPCCATAHGSSASYTTIWKTRSRRTPRLF